MRRRKPEPPKEELFKGDWVKVWNDDTIYRLTGHITSDGQYQMSPLTTSIGNMFSPPVWHPRRHLSKVYELPEREVKDEG